MKKKTMIFILFYASLSSSIYANYLKTVLPLHRSTHSQDVDNLASMGFHFGDAEKYETLSNVIKSGRVCNISDIYKSENRNIFNFDIIIQDNINSFKSLPDDCVKNFLENYVAFKEYFKRDEIEKYCESNPVKCENFSVLPNIYKSNILSLLNVVGKHRSYITLCEEEADLLNWTEINSLYKRAEQFEKCQELNVGESKVYKDLPGGFGRGYALEKIADKKYKMSFQINFVTTASSRVSPIDLKKRADKCMERVNKVASGPNGNKFEFSVLSSDEALLIDEKKRPPFVDIEIAGVGYRSNSGAYASDIDCDTILHELLHLTGLVDEYVELKKGFYVDPHNGEIVESPSKEAIDNKQVKFEHLYNSCRSISSTQSTMSNHNSAIAFSETTPKICECDNDPLLLPGQCRNSFKVGGRVQELFLQSRAEMRNSVSDFDKYCTKLDVIEPKFYYYSSQRELLDKKVISDYNKFPNGRSFNKMTYVGKNDGPSIAWSYPDKMICACDETRNDCKKFLGELDKVASGAVAVNIPACPIGTLAVPIDDIDNYTLKPNQALVQNQKPIHLLRESHVKYILRPECDSAAPVYKECSKYAYKKRAKDCPVKPAYCSDETQWLGK